MFGRRGMISGGKGEGDVDGRNMVFWHWQSVYTLTFCFPVSIWGRPPSAGGRRTHGREGGRTARTFLTSYYLDFLLFRLGGAPRLGGAAMFFLTF